MLRIDQVPKIEAHIIKSADDRSIGKTDATAGPSANWPPAGRHRA